MHSWCAQQLRFAAQASRTSLLFWTPHELTVFY